MADQRCSSGVVCKGERPVAGSVGICVSVMGRVWEPMVGDGWWIECDGEVRAGEGE